MKIILAKHHNCVQLLHLYEHVVISGVYDYLYSLGYFEFIDYTIKGDTFYNGTCIIELETADSTICTLALEQLNRVIDMNDSLIKNTILEVEAERQEFLSYSSLLDVRRSIAKLSKKRWLSLGEHESHEGSYVSQMPVAVAKDKDYPKTDEIIIRIELSAEFFAVHRELLPLYRLLSQAIAWNIGTRLGEKYNIYNRSVSYEGNFGGTQRVEVAWRVPSNFTFVADVIFSDIQEIVKYMHKQDAFLRMCRWLASFDYTDEASVYPDIFETYRISHNIPTYDQWKSIATVENCILLSSEMKVNLRYGDFIKQK